MSAEPASIHQQYQEILDRMSQNHLAAIDAARTHLAEVPRQGESVSPEQVGQLPVGSTPTQAAKDLVYKYGREPSPAAERTPGLEPDR